MTNLPPGLTYCGTRTNMDYHITRLEAQIEAYGQSQDPTFSPGSYEKAIYLFVSLPQSRYWLPFLAEFWTVYKVQFEIEDAGGIPNFPTWEEMVSRVLAHFRARPFLIADVPSISRWF